MMNTRRFLFLFIFSYFIFSVLPIRYDFIVEWVSGIFFDLQVRRESFTGSGDTLFHYLQSFTNLLLAGCATGILLLFKRRLPIDSLKKLFLILLRYYMALILLIYGLGKVFQQQFGEPSLFQLEKDYGSMSPMNLLWSFMGYSRTYTLFVAYSEVFAGLLLLWRRTTLFGGLSSLIVFLNVLMMNISYDVPVKLFTMHLCLWTIIIIWYHRIRLFALMDSQVSIIPEPIPPYFTSRNANRVLKISKYIFLIILVILVVWKSTGIYDESVTEVSPLRGVYNIEQFAMNGRGLTPTPNDSSYWQQLIIDGNNILIVRNGGRKFRRKLWVDTMKKELRVYFADNESDKMYFQYRLQDSVLWIRGRFVADTITAIFRQKDHRQYLLLKRGFRWVSESPFNR